MSKLIDAEKLDFVSYQGIPNGYKNSFDSGVLYAMNLIDEQPTIDAVPVAWINKHLEWLDNCDNDFAQLAKVSIFGMLELWRKDSVYGKRVTK